MAIVLLAAAGLLLRSFMSLLATETGFRPDQALAISTNLPGGGYPNAADVRRFYSDAVERIRRLPGVVATGISTDLPLLATEMRGVVIEGRDGMGAGVPPVVVHSWIAGDYLQALGVRLLRGRHLTPADRAGSTLVAVVSETAALEFWRGEDAIGKRFRWAGEDAPWRTVVGVVADVKDTDLGERPRPHSYTPVWQETDERIGETLIGMFRSPHLVLSTVGDPMSLAGPARSALRTIDAHLASGDIGPLTTHVSRTLTTRRVAALLVGGFALAALLLAGLGLHGVLAYNVSQRRQEIGIRMALGAARQDVMRLVVRDGLRMAIVGLGIGIAAALSVTGLLRGLLYDVTATDPLTFVAVSAALLAVACAATYVPARQAVTVDPAVTMRET
jgi:predicted permease